MRKLIKWLWDSSGNMLTVVGWLVSIGFFPTLLSLTREASPLAYGIASVVGMLAFAAFRLIWNGARVLKANAKARERLSSGSSVFDPMETVFQNKRLFLRDLVPPGRRAIKGRKFINCEIIGPGSLVVSLRTDDTKPYPPFQENIFWDVDMIQVEPGKLSNNAVYFPDCGFEGCHFYNLNLHFYERMTEEWYWITPDFKQPRLIEGPAEEPNDDDEAK